MMVVRLLRPEHPHGRGEKGAQAPHLDPASGTSPRAWGEGAGEVASLAVIRNIPTGVGRSCSTTAKARSGSEHPHGRGEKPDAPALRTSANGTSPRAWGEEHGQDFGHGGKRNIPTGVGRSSAGA